MLRKRSSILSLLRLPTDQVVIHSEFHPNGMCIELSGVDHGAQHMGNYDKFDDNDEDHKTDSKNGNSSGGNNAKGTRSRAVDDRLLSPSPEYHHSSSSSLLSSSSFSSASFSVPSSSSSVLHPSLYSPKSPSPSSPLLPQSTVNAWHAAAEKVREGKITALVTERLDESLRMLWRRVNEDHHKYTYELYNKAQATEKYKSGDTVWKWEHLSYRHVRPRSNWSVAPTNTSTTTNEKTGSGNGSGVDEAPSSSLVSSSTSPFSSFSPSSLAMAKKRTGPVHGLTEREAAAVRRASIFDIALYEAAVAKLEEDLHNADHKLTEEEPTFKPSTQREKKRQGEEDEQGIREQGNEKELLPWARWCDRKQQAPQQQLPSSSEEVVAKAIELCWGPLTIIAKKSTSMQKQQQQQRRRRPSPPQKDSEELKEKQLKLADKEEAERRRRSSNGDISLEACRCHLLGMDDIEWSAFAHHPALWWAPANDDKYAYYDEDGHKDAANTSGGNDEENRSRSEVKNAAAAAMVAAAEDAAMAAAEVGSLAPMAVCSISSIAAQKIRRNSSGSGRGSDGGLQFRVVPCALAAETATAVTTMARKQPFHHGKQVGEHAVYGHPIVVATDDGDGASDSLGCATQETKAHAHVAAYTMAEVGGGEVKEDSASSLVAQRTPTETEGGTVLIVRRGGCSFRDKAVNAERKGHIALVIVDSPATSQSPSYSPPSSSPLFLSSLTASGDDYSSSLPPLSTPGLGRDHGVSIPVFMIHEQSSRRLFQEHNLKDIWATSLSFLFRATLEPGDKGILLDTAADVKGVLDL